MRLPRDISGIGKRFSLVVALTLALTVAGTAGVIAATGPDRSTRESLAPAALPLGAEDLPYLKSIALEVAVRAGDSDPTSGRAYSSSRAVAVDVTSQAPVDSDQPVFVVVLEGDFLIRAGPKGATPPSGPYLHLVWDPAKREVTDFGIKESRPNMAKLGLGLDLGF
ncbi:MAG: hypothetical protein ACRDKU_00355 [Gaiellaceae bacterium]